MSLIALVGNGLSISYNLEMSVRALTAAETLQRFESADHELGAIAAEAGHGEPPGFEDLLGPFDAVSAMIRNLPEIRSGEGWSKVRGSRPPSRRHGKSIVEGRDLSSMSLPSAARLKGISSPSMRSTRRSQTPTTRKSSPLKRSTTSGS
jgi:hypothetical protein